MEEKNKKWTKKKIIIRAILLLVFFSVSALFIYWQANAIPQRDIQIFLKPLLNVDLSRLGIAAKYISSICVIVSLWLALEKMQKFPAPRVVKIVLGILFTIIGLLISLVSTKVIKLSFQWDRKLDMGKISFYYDAFVLLFIILFTDLLPSILKWKEVFTVKALLLVLKRVLIIILLALLDTFLSAVILIFYKGAGGSITRVLVAFGNLTLGGYVIYCIFDPIFEETAFRGLLFKKGSDLMPMWIAVLFSSVLFGLWHRNLTQFLYTLPMGMISCYIMFRTKKIRYCMLFHAFDNFFVQLALTSNPKSAFYVPVLDEIRKQLIYRTPVSRAVIYLIILLILFGFLFIFLPDHPIEGMKKVKEKIIKKKGK